VGVPGPERPNLLFACDGTSLEPPAAASYREESARGGTRRLVRPPGAAASPWPDTLVVRRFADPADEEIALERGELDAAVFWPGEVSPRAGDPGPRPGLMLGTRSRGLVAAIGLVAEARDSSAADARDSSAAGAPETPTLERLNRELFRGDLLAWDAAPSSNAATRDARIEVDRACPGWQVLERTLNRGRPRGPHDDPAARLVYLDVPVGRPDSLARGIAEYLRGRSLPPEDSLRVTPLFTVRCPILFAPALGGYLGSLGPDALADLLRCPTPRREP